jgi:TRAP-type mannitol/chloroaromatic compound transport system substrate-binding protein
MLRDLKRLAADVIKETSVVTERRRFILTAGGGMAAAAATAIVDVPHVIAQPKIQWRMSTAYPPALVVQLGAAQRLAKAVEEMSSGRFRIEVFPAGQIMGPFECFDAASQGKIEAFHGGAVFWAEKEPAFQWFNSVPFGMNPAGMVAWLYQGDGLKLWEEAYAAFNLVPRPGSQNGPEMGGWFRKKITTIADYKGLKMRIPGLGLNRKAHEALPVDLRRMLDHAAAAVQVYGLTDFHVKNAIALERLRTEFKSKVEILQYPAPMLRELKKLAAEVVREESEKSPMARKVHASFTKFQALLAPWDHVAEGAYHQLVAG